MIKEARLTFELPAQLNSDSRVWIYQSSRELTEQEVDEMSQLMEGFVNDWAAHGKDLQADFKILFNRFVCLFVDETAHGASGCSIDSSVHFIQELESKFGINLMNRTETAFISGESLRVVHMNDLQNLADKGEIDKDTLIFNNLVKTKGEMQSNWLIPISESWHHRLIK